MLNLKMKIILFIASLLTAAISGTADARDYNVLVVGEDKNKKTLARNTEPFEQVMNSISRKLSENNFRVIDEVMATRDKFVQGRIRRSKQELFDIAKLIVDPPIDFIVTFKVFAEFETSTTVKLMTLRSSSQIFALSTNQLITNVKTTPLKGIPTEKLCNLRKRCRMKYIGENAERLGNQLGKQLVARLLGYLSDKHGNNINEREKIGSNPKTGNQITRAHKLIFEGFSADQYFEIEKYLIKTSGYINHRIIKL